MSTPAPSPPAAAPPEPPPPPPEPGLFYCHECGATAFLHGPLPVPVPPLHVCPTCQRGFLEERPRSSSPPPPPPPPPHLAGSGSSSSELSDDDSDSDDDGIELASENYAATREYFRSVVDRSSRYDGPDLGDAAAAVAMSALRQRGLAIVRQRALLHQPALAAARGGEPPAPAASIAALPTVEVAEPAAACAICKDDLPLASQARKLPCAHLYHSPCIVTWLEMHNSCPVCRFRIPSAAAAAGPEPEGAAPEEEEGSSPTRITIRFTTTARRRRHVLGDAAAAGPVSVSATQLAQAFTEDAAAGPANSGETVSSEWPPHPESDAVMSEAREGDVLFD